MLHKYVLTKTRKRATPKLLSNYSPIHSKNQVFRTRSSPFSSTYLRLFWNLLFSLHSFPQHLAKGIKSFVSPSKCHRIHVPMIIIYQNGIQNFNLLCPGQSVVLSHTYSAINNHNFKISHLYGSQNPANHIASTKDLEKNSKKRQNAHNSIDS